MFKNSFSILAFTAFICGITVASGAETEAKATAGVSSVKNVDAEQASKILQEDKKVMVLDVRTPEEFSAGHIAGATNLNFRDPGFEKKLAALDKKKPYLVHCAAGGRSSKARELMKKLNFESIYHLEGGLNA